MQANPPAMTDDAPLLGLLERIEAVGDSGSLRIADVVEAIGTKSFAALMLIFALIAVSPASVVPGVTTAVAAIEFILVAQMIGGRRQLWLPELLSQRQISGKSLATAMTHLHRPVTTIERLLKPRLQFLTEKPVLYIWLMLILCLTLCMPFMEVVPGSGTVASSFIALVAAAILTRDGVLMILAGGCLIGLVALLVWLGGVIF